MPSQIKSNLVLIGMMGSGKSAIAQELSIQYHLKLIDTDSLIESETRDTISNIINNQGEEHFREIETGVLKRLTQSQAQGQVYATGGGIVKREANHPLLKQLGTIIWLKASAETIIERLSGDNTRPLLHGDNPAEKIKQILTGRENIYSTLADQIIQVDSKSIKEIVQEIKL